MVRAQQKCSMFFLQRTFASLRKRLLCMKKVFFGHWMIWGSLRRTNDCLVGDDSLRFFLCANYSNCPGRLHTGHICVYMCRYIHMYISTFSCWLKETHIDLDGGNAKIEQQLLQHFMRQEAINAPDSRQATVGTCSCHRGLPARVAEGLG